MLLLFPQEPKANHHPGGDHLLNTERRYSSRTRYRATARPAIIPRTFSPLAFVVQGRRQHQDHVKPKRG